MATLGEMLGFTSRNPAAEEAALSAYLADRFPAPPPPAPKVMEPDLLEMLQGRRLPPGVQVGDDGRLYDKDFKPIEQVRRGNVLPITADEQGNVRFAAPKILDILGFSGSNVMGSAPKGAMRAGFYREADTPTPSYYAGDPTATEALARHIEASQLRARNGRAVPSITDEKGLTKLDNALTKLSTPPSQNAMGKAERALEMGLDTPAFHITRASAVDPEAAKRSAPFFEMDPFQKTRGSMYFGDLPSTIVRSGAAQTGGSSPMAFGFMLGKHIFGETPLPPGLARSLPETVQLQGGQPLVAELVSAMNAIPSYKMGQARLLEETQRYFKNGGGGKFDPAQYAARRASAEEDMASALAQLYYQEVVKPGQSGTLKLTQPNEFVAAAPKESAVPPWGLFEQGAKPTVGSNTGLHGWNQNVLASLGFGGSRVRDETAALAGKSFAMMDPSAVRSTGAQFRDPFGNLISGNVPPGLFSFPMSAPNE